MTSHPHGRSAVLPSVRPIALATVIALLAWSVAALAASPAASFPAASFPAASFHQGWAASGAAASDSDARTSIPPRGRIGPGVKGWRINERNVGLAPYGLSCDGLKTYRGPANPPAGTRIHRKLVTVPLDLSAGDITVSKSCIRPTSTGYHNDFLVTTTTCSSTCSATSRGRVVIRDSEISGLAMGPEDISTSCAFLGVADLRRNYLHGMGSGICYFETGQEHSAEAEQNYVTGLRSYGDSHNEAATVRDFEDALNPGRSLVLRNNRLDCSSGNVTAGLFIQPTWESIYHVDVIGNYIEGEGYNLYLDHTMEGESGASGDLRAIDNRFRSTGWGESEVADGAGWDAWQDNYVFSPGRTGGKGRPVRP